MQNMAFVLAARANSEFEAIERVQANLIEMAEDDDASVRQWRDKVRAAGIWANDPVPLFPYPGSLDYTKRWGKPDDFAWERAHSYYLDNASTFSDIQNQQPTELVQLELHAAGH